MSANPERLQLPADLPVATTIADVPASASRLRNWWFDARRVLNDAIDGLRRGKNKFDSDAGFGSGALTLGTKAPAVLGTPYAWVDVIAPDGTSCVMPIWKKAT